MTARVTLTSHPPPGPSRYAPAGSRSPHGSSRPVEVNPFHTRLAAQGPSRAVSGWAPPGLDVAVGRDDERRPAMSG